MDYFDFHMHPTLKTTLKADLTYDTQIPSNAVSGIVGCCSDLPQIVASQASVKQLMRNFDQKLVGVALYSIESVIAADKTLNQVASTNKKLKNYIDAQRLQDVANHNLKAFDYLKNILLPVFKSKPEFQIIDKNTDLSALDTNKIHVFFSVEGCHSLCNTSNTIFDKTEIIQNLKELSSIIPIVSVNPTHLQKSNIANQAFGIQLTNNAAFIPQGNGISEDGEEIIQACFSLGICIDVKHMSLISRKQLFQQVKNDKYQNAQPIICTHAGFTGIASGEIADYILALDVRDGGVKVIHGKPNHIDSNIDHLQRPAPAFNASSINLYDEEIVDIIKNGGLIGLSFDRRISGFVSQFDEDPYAFLDDETYVVDKEYFSPAEFQQLGINPDNIRSKINDAFCNVKDDLLQVSDPPSTLQDYHRTQIMLQLKHFLQVCINNDIPLATAQTKVCMGSDFDGIINPFYCAMTVDDISKFKTFLKKNFFDFLGRYTDAREWRDQLDVNEFAEQFFYLNGNAFIAERMKVLNFTNPPA